MAAYQSRDPGLAVRVQTLVESGLTAEEVARTLVEDNVQRELAKKEGSATFAEETEVFADEIKVIAQALAYRPATEEDLGEIAALLDAAYAPEVRGEESFRSAAGGDGKYGAVTLESVQSLFHDATYSWQVVEAPSGRGVEVDGVILGACCYSTDGVSRKNGQVEGSLGSLRYFGVLPRFHGVCVGRRLLHRVEALMTQAGCVRSMACLPSTRAALRAWLERRGYRLAGQSPYPFAALGHAEGPGAGAGVGAGGVALCVFVKPLEGAAEAADGKTAKKTVLSLSPSLQAGAGSGAGGGEGAGESEGEGRGLGEGEDSDEGERRSGLPLVPGKMHLPPQWRGYSAEDLRAATAAAAAAASGAETAAAAGRVGGGGDADGADGKGGGRREASAGGDGEDEFGID